MTASTAADARLVVALVSRLGLRPNNDERTWHHMGALIVDAALAGAYGLLADIDANLIYALVATSGAVLILSRLAVPPHVHARLLRLPDGIDADVARDDLSLAA